MNFTLSPHAEESMRERGISKALVEKLSNHPEQVIPEREGRMAYQARLTFEGGTEYLLRAIVNDLVDPAVVVTVYRTTKIAKYWRTS